jgi:hypothetical protein
MSIRSSKLVAVFVGLLFFAAIQQMARQDAVASPPDQPQLRTWTNRQGIAIQAKFVGLDGDNVVLKKDDGKMYPVPFVSLSDADQQYVRQRAGAKGEPEEKPAPTPRKTAPTQRSSVAMFTNKKTGETFKGKILKFEEDAGYGKYLVETDDGRQGWLYLRQWTVKRIGEGNLENPHKITTDPAAPDGSEQLPPEEGQPGRAVVKMNPSGGKKPLAAAPLQAAEVVVTGVGTDPEKAVQNAFSEAIEQTVGVLVDAESAVKNDQLIRDEVLTYKFEVVKRWEEGGLQHATILAVVARGKLVEKLRGIKIAVDEISGGLAARQFRFDAENERRAAEMFQKALDDFDLTKLTKVEIVEKPEITRDGSNANVRIRAKVSPDMTRWEEFSHGLRALLAAIASGHAGVSAKPTRGGEVFIVSVRGTPLKHQLSGQGILVGLLANASGERAQWELFRVPDIMDGPVKEAAKKSYHLVYTLLDDQGATVVRTDQPITGRERTNHRLGPIYYGKYHTDMPDIGHDNAWWIGPVLMGWTFLDVCDVAHYETQNTVSISQEDLSKVVKTVVLLEEDTGHGNLGHAKHSSATHEPRGSRSGSGTSENSHKRGQ